MTNSFATDHFLHLHDTDFTVFSSVALDGLAAVQTSLVMESIADSLLPLSCQD